MVAALALAAAPAAAAATTITVQPGQDLTQIAAEYHTTVAALAAANGVTNPNLVYAGAVLQIPGTGGDSARSGPVTTSMVVSPGETLTSIAAQYHTTVAALVATNGIANPNLVFAGVLLRLPSTWVLADYTTPAGSGGASDASGSGGDTAGFPPQLLAHPDRLSLLPDFTSAASTYGVPASLLEAMCWWESGWQAAVVSPTGAVGVCQLEPFTTAFVNSVLLGGTSLDPQVPAQNIDLSAAYLHNLLTRTGGSQRLALAAYYQGLLSVQQNGLLSSTQTYVQGILAYSALFAAA